MKKITAMLLCILMILALVGCGGNEGGNEITALYDEGFSFSLSSYDESSWTGIFQKDVSYDTVYLVTGAMTAKLYKDYDSVGFDDPKYDAKIQNILGQLTDVTVTDITDKVPTQEVLDSFIGMTIGELEELGFERNGYMGDEDMGYEFFLDGPVFTLNVSPEAGSEITNMDDYSENDIRALVIGGVEFTGFSFNFING